MEPYVWASFWLLAGFPSSFLCHVWGSFVPCEASLLMCDTHARMAARLPLLLHITCPGGHRGLHHSAAVRRQLGFLHGKHSARLGQNLQALYTRALEVPESLFCFAWSSKSLRPAQFHSRKRNLRLSVGGMPKNVWLSFTCHLLKCYFFSNLKDELWLELIFFKCEAMIMVGVNYVFNITE